MDKKLKYMAAISMLSASLANAGLAAAHMEPEAGDGMETCYGVAKVGKNDCASAAAKHDCAGMSSSTQDADPKEWIKVPQGLCLKLAGGSLEPKEN